MKQQVSVGMARSYSLLKYEVIGVRAELGEAGEGNRAL